MGASVADCAGADVGAPEAVGALASVSRDNICVRPNPRPRNPTSTATAATMSAFSWIHDSRRRSRRLRDSLWLEAPRGGAVRCHWCSPLAARPGVSSKSAGTFLRRSEGNGTIRSKASSASERVEFQSGRRGVGADCKSTPGGRRLSGSPASRRFYPVQVPLVKATARPGQGLSVFVRSRERGLVPQSAMAPAELTGRLPANYVGGCSVPMNGKSKDPAVQGVLAGCNSHLTRGC